MSDTVSPSVLDDEKKAPSASSSSSSSTASSSLLTPSDDLDDPPSPSASSSSLDPAAAERRRLANRRKKEKAKQRRKPSPLSTPLSAELAAFESSFPTLSMHRFFQPPLHLAFDPREGRHLRVADGKITEGEEVFTQPAYGLVVRDDYVASICHRCLRSAAVLLKCAACHHAHYCSPQCKKAHERLHHHECRTLQQIQRGKDDGESSSIRLLVRILAQRFEEQLAIAKHREKLKSLKSKGGKGGKTAETLPATLQPGLTFPDVLGLQSHVEALSAEDRQAVLGMLGTLTGGLEEVLGDAGVELMLQVLCVIHVNAHHVTNHNKERLAVGLYTAAALMNHSCAPSCVYHYTDKGEIVMKAVTAMTEGSTVTYAYCDVYQPRATRWQTLRQVYKMPQCECERCLVPLPDSWDRFIQGQQCTQCNAGLVSLSPDGSGQCNQCRLTFPAEVVRECEESADTLLAQALSLYQAGQQAVVAQTVRQRLLVAPGSPLRPHPYSFPAFQAYFVMLPTLSALEEWGEVGVYAGLARECLEGAGLQGHPEYADVLVVEGEAKGKEGKMEEGRALLERAREGRERLYGRKHILTRDVQTKLSRA